MPTFNPNQGEQQGDLQPPPAVPVRQFTTPDASDGFYTERVDVTSPEYRPIQRGTLYSSIPNADQNVIDRFAELRFVQETLNPFYHPWAIRTWATDRLSEDTYNAAVEYVSEAVDFPAYTRIYMVRRDLYDSFPTKEIGTPLDTLIGVKILDPGGAYTSAEFHIEPENGAEIQPLFENGSDPKGSKIIGGIITKHGSGFVSAPELQIVGDGSGARAEAIIQPQSAVLVSQKKHELPDNHPLGNEYVLVTRVYETLPGPWVISQKHDTDGVILTIKTRRNKTADIEIDASITGNAWEETSKVGKDDFVAEETNESRTVITSDAEAAAAPALITEKPDEDEMTIVTKRQMASQEYIETIDPLEFFDNGNWVRISTESIDELRAWLITTTRPIPGNPIAGSAIDSKGNILDQVRTLKKTADIVPTEDVVGSTWIKRYGKEITGLVSWEIVEAMELPGVTVPSAQVNGDHEVVTIAKRYRPQGSITPSATESGGIITEVIKNEVTDSVSEEETRVYPFLDKASYSIEIPNLIPAWARPQIPTLVESHILAGTASQPVLASREFQVTESQITELLYERRVTKIPDDVSFPVTATNTQTGEQYGGALLHEIVVLDETEFTADTGFLIVSSQTTTLAVYNNPPPSGLYMKQTLFNPGTEWPTLPGRDWNEEFQTYDLIETQVMELGVYVPPDPLPDFTVEDLRPIDTWRTRRIRRTVDPGDHIGPGNALISYRYHPFQFPGTLDYNRLITFDHQEGYRLAAALLARHVIRTWWLVRDSDDPPTVGNTDLGTFDIDVKEIISDTVNIPIYSPGSTIGAQRYRDVLHDNITNTLGAFYPATTPSFTEYYLGISSGSGGSGSIYAITAPGTGYTLGGTITVCGSSCTILAVGVSNSIVAISQPAAPPSGVIITGLSNAGACSVSGGGGSGAAFDEFVATYDTVIPGSGWVGNERVISADVKYQNIPRLWKVVTESVVMR